MKKEGTFGAATLLAIAAVVGVTMQTGPKPEPGGKAGQAEAVKHAKPAIPRRADHPVLSGCGGLKDQLEDFLDVKELAAPGECYPTGVTPPPQVDLSDKTSQLKFVIALMPDPVHTHMSGLFDQFSVSIQEGAQDEQYDFDSSWLPWDDEESTYALLDDQKKANQEKDVKEDQPGIILFRKKGTPSQTYYGGLVVFVVGEEATEGIHGEQFRNALEWIGSLDPKAAAPNDRLAILGPTFSGSFPSLTRALTRAQADPTIAKLLNLGATADGRRLAIYSGSVSGRDPARAFQKVFKSQVSFHSFVQSDDEIFRRFCNYIKKEQHGFEVGNLAIISEDETAYGNAGIENPDDKKADEENSKLEEGNDCDKAVKIFYPRDISTLRGAYQTKSLFEVGATAQPGDTQRRNLPTDLADPSGKVHDSIRTFGANQTPLTQEAFLLEIVASLRDLNTRYILLRSSSTLDQLFLTNFLRRGYPDARIVILSSDLMFIRERGSTGLSGALTLSTYPLFPLERDWTEHQSSPATDRVFSGDTIEGTYVALRLLLNEKRLNKNQSEPDRCWVVDQQPHGIFVPPIACNSDPIPDYSAPFWTLANQCGEMTHDNADKIATTGKDCPYLGPATWLSVIGTNRFWPMASLIHDTPTSPSADARKTERAKDREKDPGGLPTIPFGMRVFLFILAAFSVFHAGCCWLGSYMAKPAFRAHFASTGDWRHTWLIFGGSCCVASMALVTGWGCGLFSIPATGLPYPWFAFAFVTPACLAAWAAILASNRTARKLSQDISCSPDLPRMTKRDLVFRNLLTSGLFVAWIVCFCLLCILPVELQLLPENRVLTYWRAMHLTSGVSPIVPVLLVLAGMYLSFWFTLHGLALFGPDRPCLPSKERLLIIGPHKIQYDFLRMFSHEDAATRIEEAAKPLTGKIVSIGVTLVVVFFAAACLITGGVPIRSLGAESYSVIFILFLDACCAMAIVETWRLCRIWDELKRLLAFLDRLPLRRTLAALRGFSWGGVWRMSGNVLEVRYKVISRQMECMNHTITSLRELLATSSDPGARSSLAALLCMRRAGLKFGKWYADHYTDSHAGDLTSFSKFQQSISAASGTLLSKLLVPAWRMEEESLLVESVKDEKDDAAPSRTPQSKARYLCNAEEFVCLNYLGFIQNILGRLRTMAITIMLLLIVSTVATSAYPFDPQQLLSAVLIVLFVIVGAVIVKVYADMHRDSTLSHVTNTKPGELGPEFWFKIIGFGFAPLVGLLTRIFPSITDFIFTWLQPSVSSLK